MDVRFVLRCLGQPALHSPNGDPIRFRTRKHLALLVYLAVEPRLPHRRDRLTELLWPRVSEHEGRHSLATALSVLRARLGPDTFDCSRDFVRLTHPGLALDLDRLAAGDVLGSEYEPALQVASFLEGFEVGGAAEFMLWKDRQQARWLPAIKSALIQLMDRCRRTGNFPRIEELADRMLGLDELSEEAIRAKMEARAFSGDRLTALRIFEAWEQQLAAELGAVPSALLEGMAIRLRRRGWERTTAPHIPTVPTDQWKDRPFVGRGAEYQVLYEGWERTGRGEAGHAFVLGDSGIGKSTLAQRLATAAGLEGAAVSRVQCYELEREIPYAAVGALVQGLLERPGASATAPEALAELARTIPEVRRRFPNLPPASESQGETARLRLTEAFHELVGAVAEEQPVILVVDDLHFADDASLAVLHLVLRRIGGQPVMLLLLGRPNELDEAPQASQLRENAPRLGIRMLELAPLPDEDATALIFALTRPEGRRPSVTARRALLRGAAGYPMVLDLLVQDWLVAGDGCLALSVDAMIPEPEAGGASLEAYRTLVQRRIRALDPTSRNVLNLAAILGRRLNDLEMYAIADLGIGQTMAGIARLTGQRMLRDGGQGLEFVNEVVRACAYFGVPLPIRKELHSRIADRLLGRRADGMAVSGLELAWHCTRANRINEATPFLLSGARDALCGGAPHEAERALESALPVLQPAKRHEAMLLLVEVLQEQGRWSDSLQILDTLSHTETAAFTEVLRVAAKHASRRLSQTETAASLDALTAIASDYSDPRTAVAAAHAAIPLLAELRDCHNLEILLRAIDQYPLDAFDERQLQEIALTRAQLLYHGNQREASLSCILALLNRLEEAGVTNRTVARLFAGLGAIRIANGQYGDALSTFEQAYARASRLGNDTLCGAAAAHAALCCGRLGLYAEQLRWGDLARATFGSQFAGYTEIQAGYYIAFAHAMTGNRNRAHDALTAVTHRLDRDLPQWMTQSWLLCSADVLQLLEEKKDAARLAAQAVGEPDLQLHHTCLAGAFARWIAVTRHPSGADTESMTIIQKLHRNLNELDRLDQLEVLCAVKSMGKGSAANTSAALESEIVARLDELPEAVRHQLVRLGVM